MRLQPNEKDLILQSAHEIYGDGVRIYLFGSRTNDAQRGGDIDLLVRTEKEKQGVLARIRFIARMLGDQKIDVIGDHENNHVVDEALKTGILLV